MSTFQVLRLSLNKVNRVIETGIVSVNVPKIGKLLTVGFLNGNLCAFYKCHTTGKMIEQDFLIVRDFQVFSEYQSELYTYVGSANDGHSYYHVFQYNELPF